MPKVSVIVPVYKVESYLCRCVDSILSQTFTDFELIMVDDGSPDNCGAICDAYAVKDDRIKVIHQKNGGLSAARNAGLQYACSQSKSEWVTFIDSDDWVDPQYLKYLYKAVAENNVGISSCRYLETTNRESEAKGSISSYKCNVLSPEDYYVESRVNAIVAWGKMYKKDAFVSKRFPVGKIHEDEYLTYQLLFEEQLVGVVESQLYFYYQNPDGIIKSEWSPRKLDVIGALKNQTQYFKSQKYYRAYKCALGVYIRLLVTNIVTLQNNHMSKQIERNLKRELRFLLLNKNGRESIKENEYRLWYYDVAFPRLMNAYWIIHNKIH